MIQGRFYSYGILFVGFAICKMNSADQEQQQNQDQALDADADVHVTEVEVLDELTDDHDVDENLPYILKSYFKVTGKVVDGKAPGKCTLCPSTQKEFSATLRVTTNLTAHLVRPLKKASVIQNLIILLF